MKAIWYPGPVHHPGRVVGTHGQRVGLVWWILGMILAITYFILTYRLLQGKVSVTQTAGY